MPQFEHDQKDEVVKVGEEKLILCVEERDACGGGSEGFGVGERIGS